MNASSIRRWVMALQIAVIVMLLGLGFALYEYSRASASLKEAKENCSISIIASSEASKK